VENTEVFQKKDSIHITPPANLQGGIYQAPVDIVEVMTYIALALFNDIELTLGNVNTRELVTLHPAEFETLERMGVRLEMTADKIFVPRTEKITNVDIDVFNTGICIYSDCQPFFALILTRAEGESRIREFVWYERFSYAVQMMKLGFSLQVSGNSLKISKSTARCSGENLVANDLRAAAILLLAALRAPGVTTINGVSHLTRGYPDFIGSLRNLGANIEVVI
jgi:UDP-N-acetylglucosamine 1-carboxyvinyltransferase